MNRARLDSPVPRSDELPYSEFSYPVEHRHFLAVPDPLPETQLAHVLAARNSRRSFQKLPLKHFSSLLWYSTHALEVSLPGQPRWQHRPAPSARGTHPLDLLVLNYEDNSSVAYLYEPATHTLCRRKLTSGAQTLDHFLQLLNKVLPVEHGTVLWFAAQFDRTLAKYQNGESLVWRDCGALIATISLVAECLELNSCAVGITGEPHISQLLSAGNTVVGAGGLIVGARA